MRSLALIMLVAILFFQYRYWLGDDGRTQVVALQESIAKQQAVNAELKRHNQQLYAEVIDLREGLDAVEERARAELGMIKSDEIFYQFIEP